MKKDDKIIEEKDEIKPHKKELKSDKTIEVKKLSDKILKNIDKLEKRIFELEKVYETVVKKLVKSSHMCLNCTRLEASNYCTEKRRIVDEYSNCEYFSRI